MDLPLRRAIYEIVVEFEDKNKRPPYISEVAYIYMRERARYGEFIRRGSLMFHFLPPHYIGNLAQDMVNDDVFYTDEEQIQLGTKAWDSKFMKASERLRTDPKFVGLELSPTGHEFVTGSREPVNF